MFLKSNCNSEVYPTSVQTNSDWFNLYFLWMKSSLKNSRLANVDDEMAFNPHFGQTPTPTAATLGPLKDPSGPFWAPRAEPQRTRPGVSWCSGSSGSWRTWRSKRCNDRVLGHEAGKSGSVAILMCFSSCMTIHMVD